MLQRPAALTNRARVTWHMTARGLTAPLIAARLIARQAQQGGADLVRVERLITTTRRQAHEPRLVSALLMTRAVFTAALGITPRRAAPLSAHAPRIAAHITGARMPQPARDDTTALRGTPGRTLKLELAQRLRISGALTPALKTHPSGALQRGRAVIMHDARLTHRPAWIARPRPLRRRDHLRRTPHPQARRNSPPPRSNPHAPRSLPRVIAHPTHSIQGRTTSPARDLPAAESEGRFAPGARWLRGPGRRGRDMRSSCH